METVDCCIYYNIYILVSSTHSNGCVAALYLTLYAAHEPRRFRKWLKQPLHNIVRYIIIYISSLIVILPFSNICSVTKINTLMNRLCVFARGVRPQYIYVTFCIYIYNQIKCMWSCLRYLLLKITYITFVSFPSL